MLTYIVVAVSSYIAGAIQSAAGFGGSTFMMLFLPGFFGMTMAPALAPAIAMCLETSLVWNFRKYIDPKICLFPTSVYLVFSILTIQLIKGIELAMLTLLFGLFLILLALFFFFFSSKISFHAGRKTAIVCAAASGISSGLFGIGGPLMAIYFVSATDTNESYIANLQFLFFTTNLINTFVRAVNGIYTADLVPYTILGMAGILLGRNVGLKILTQLKTDQIKRIVYTLVGIFGVITVLKQLK